MSNFITSIWSKYKEIISIVSFLVLTTGFIVASIHAQQRVNEFESTFERIAQLAEGYADPNTWLRHYLLNHNVDSTTAKIWSVMPKGEVVVNKDTLTNIPFLNPNTMPEIGIQLVRKPGGTIKTLDTLWNFTKKAK